MSQILAHGVLQFSYQQDVRCGTPRLADTSRSLQAIVVKCLLEGTMRPIRIVAALAGLTVGLGACDTTPAFAEPVPQPDTVTQAEVAQATLEALRLLPPDVNFYCLVYCHPDPNVEQWHQLAVDVGLVDPTADYGDHSWRLWGPIIKRESDGDPTQDAHYSCCHPVGLTQLDVPSWAGFCRRAGIISGWQDLLSADANLTCAAAVRDRAGIRQWKGPVAMKGRVLDFPDWARKVLSGR